jgi:hypothetical protein
MTTTDLYILLLDHGLTFWQKLSGPVSRARCHPRFAGVFAFGGKDVDLEIWRPATFEFADKLPTLQPWWQAKNVCNDEYNLRQPVWISDLHFLDEQRRDHDAGYRVVVCTRFHQVTEPRLFSQLIVLDSSI